MTLTLLDHIKHKQFTHSPLKQTPLIFLFQLFLQILLYSNVQVLAHSTGYFISSASPCHHSSVFSELVILRQLLLIPLTTPIIIRFPFNSSFLPLDTYPPHITQPHFNHHLKHNTIIKLFMTLMQPLKYYFYSFNDHFLNLHCIQILIIMFSKSILSQ